MSKTPPEPSRWVSTKEAYRLLGVSRARFDEWRTDGLISPDWHNGNRPMYLRADVVALPYRLPRGSNPVGPLLPPEDRALVRERVGEPDFSRIFTECFESLAPSRGENEARRRALANMIRAYRKFHDCDYRPAAIAVRALIPPPAPIDPPQPAAEPLIEPDDDPQSTGLAAAIPRSASSRTGDRLWLASEDMTAAEALALAKAQGVTITLDGAELELSADRKPDPDLLDAIAGRKADIVAFLHPDAVRRRLEAEAGVPRAPRPPDVTDVAWKTAVDGLRAFIAGGYGAEAERCGWTKAELYRVPELWSQINLTGAALLISGREVVSITPTEIRLKVSDGSMQAAYKKPSIDYGVAYRTRLKMAGEDSTKSEVQWRAREATVNLFRANNPGTSIDEANAVVRAAIEPKGD